MRRINLALALLITSGAASAAFRWVCYSPSYPFRPNQAADSALVCGDLACLHEYGFGGIVTYGVSDSLGRVARYARANGFDSIIMGVWIDVVDSINRREVLRAIAESASVDAYCVGNEVLFFGRRDTAFLRWAMDTVRQASGKPVTTAEHWTVYDWTGIREWLLRNCDFLFPIANPTNEAVRNPDSAVIWVKERFDHIAVMGGESLRVLVKEAGWPTSSTDTMQFWWANESCQCRLFSLLDTLRDTSAFRFCHFEAFDGYWKDWGPEERYWGLFDQYRNPKRYARTLQPVEVREGRGDIRSPRPHATIGFPSALTGASDVYALSGRRVSDCRDLSEGVYFIREPLAGGVRKVIVTR
jgi:exo-beta-1,3-glucanase (GH17 family)